MAEPEVDGEPREIERMQRGLRAFVARGWRPMSTRAFLSSLCAATFAPVIMPAAGVTGADAVAAVTVLSSIGGGVLSSVLVSAYDRLRSGGQPAEHSDQDREQEFARQIERVLTAGNPESRVLMREIDDVLRKVSAWEVLLEAGIASGEEGLRAVLDAIKGLGNEMAGTQLLIDDVQQSSAVILRNQQAQLAEGRARYDQLTSILASISRAMDALAVESNRAAEAGEARAERRGRWKHECPYRGLAPYREADEEVFYGREQPTSELATFLGQQLNRGQLVAVTGPSGVGKSSLLRAGLVPALRLGIQLPGSRHWPPPVVMTPTDDPLTELATRLEVYSGLAVAGIRDQLAGIPDQAHLTVRQVLMARADWQQARGLRATGEDATRLVLIVDQFEEALPLRSGQASDRERHSFVTALLAAATKRSGPGQNPHALVVLVVRGDYWQRCADTFPQLADWLEQGRFVVGPMPEPDLVRAITGPAGAAGLRVQPELIDTIVHEVRVAGSMVGVLPLLSQAMLLTWGERDGDLLTLRGYGQAGGITGAVEASANDVYENLPAGQQPLARRLLRAMTVPEGELARRVVRRADLYSVASDASPEHVDEVLNAFAAKRLLVLDEEDTAQISHDALLTEWQMLHDWLSEDRESVTLHSRLATAAEEWQQHNKKASYLYREDHLAEAQQAARQWSAEPDRFTPVTATEREFLRTSELAEHKRKIRRRAAIWVPVALALLTAAASVGFYINGQRASQQRYQAIYNQVGAEALGFGTSNIPLAAQLNLAAYRLQPSQDLATRLLNTENTPLSFPLTSRSGRASFAVAFSPHGHALASSIGSTVRLWDVADPAHPQLLGQLPALATGGAVDAVAFSPDGHTLVSGDDGGRVTLWDVTDPAYPYLLSQVFASGSGNAVSSVAFSPDGRTLASTYFDGSVQLWDVAIPAQPGLLGQRLTTGVGGVDAVAFSPHGHTLASAYFGDKVGLWDIAHPAHPRLLGQALASGSDGTVYAAAFSPDGHTLASGGTDGTLQLLDVAHPADPRPLGQPLTTSSGRNGVFSVAFSPDGRTLATGNLDGTCGLWDVTDPAHPRQLGQPLASGSSGAVDAVAFSPDGHTLASGSADGTLRLWTLPLTVLTSASGEVHAVAFSADGHTLATGNLDGAGGLWDVTDPAHPQPLGQPLTISRGLGVSAMAFSPHGHTLASGDDGGTVRLWDVADPADPRPLGQPPTTSIGSVDAVAFSPDGHTLASAYFGGLLGGTVQLWDVADPADPRQLGQPLSAGGSGHAIVSMAFSPDGHTLASAYFDGTVRLWDVADPADPRQLGQPLAGGGSGTVYTVTVAFSPVGHTLATGNLDGTIRLWDVADSAHPQSLGRPLDSGSGGSVDAVAFSPDGRTLASGSADGRVELWDVADPAHSQSLGQLLTGGGGVDAVAFSPDGRTLASGSADGITRLWNMDVHDAIERICVTAGDLTHQQWRDYISQLPYQPLCDDAVTPFLGPRGRRSAGERGK